MSEQKPELSSAETGSAGTPAASEAVLGPGQAAAEIESPGIAPNQEETAPKADAPKIEPKVEAKVEPKLEPKLEAPKVEAPKVEASKPEAPRIPGNVMIMSPGDRKGASAKAEAEPASGKRRASAMAAVVAMAAVAGALGGALATAGLGHFTGTDTASVRNIGLEASVARLDADVAEPAPRRVVARQARAALDQVDHLGSIREQGRALVEGDLIEAEQVFPVGEKADEGLPDGPRADDVDDSFRSHRGLRMRRAGDPASTAKHTIPQRGGQCETFPTLRPPRHPSGGLFS